MGTVTSMLQMLCAFELEQRTVGCEGAIGAGAGYPCLDAGPGHWSAALQLAAVGQTACDTHHALHAKFNPVASQTWPGQGLPSLG